MSRSSSGRPAVYGRSNYRAPDIYPSTGFNSREAVEQLDFRVKGAMDRFKAWSDLPEEQRKASKQRIVFYQGERAWTRTNTSFIAPKEDFIMQLQQIFSSKT